MNILITNIGRRGYLVDYFREAITPYEKSTPRIVMQRQVGCMVIMMVSLYYPNLLMTRRNM